MVKVQLADLLQRVCDKHSFVYDQHPKTVASFSFEFLEHNSVESPAKVINEIQKRTFGTLYNIYPMKPRFYENRTEPLKVLKKPEDDSENS